MRDEVKRKEKMVNGRRWKKEQASQGNLLFPLDWKSKTGFVRKAERRNTSMSTASPSLDPLMAHEEPFSRIL